MPRKVLADKIELEPVGSGRQRGYKFRGALSLEKLIAGEAMNNTSDYGGPNWIRTRVSELIDELHERGGDLRGEFWVRTVSGPAQIVTAVDFEGRDARADQRAGGGELSGGGEGVGGAVDEQRRHADRRQVRGAQLLRLAGRVERVGLQQQAAGERRL